MTTVTPIALPDRSKSSGLRRLHVVPLLAAGALLLSACSSMTATVTEKPADPGFATLTVSLSTSPDSAFAGDMSTENLQIRVDEVDATTGKSEIVAPTAISSQQCGVSPTAPTTYLTCGSESSYQKYGYTLKVPQKSPHDVYRVSFYDSSGYQISTAVTYIDGLG